jgi:hypothetical protein
VSVFGEGERIDSRRGARVDLDRQAVEDAGTGLWDTGTDVDDRGLPVVVEVIVGKRFAGVYKSASGACGKHEVGVLAEHGQARGGVVELVTIAGHSV